MTKINFRNKYLRITIRVLLGLMFLGSGISGWMSGLNHMQGVPEAMIPSSQSLWDAGIFQMIKTTEIVAGLMLVTGFLPWLAAIAVTPICVGIFVFNLNLHVPGGYYMSGIIVSLLTLYLGYAYWEKYKPLFRK